MEHTVFDSSNYLVEIQKTKTFGMGTITETWYWEVTIANRFAHYKVKAFEPRMNALIDWFDVTEGTPKEVAIARCKDYMDRQ